MDGVRLLLPLRELAPAFVGGIRVNAGAGVMPGFLEVTPTLVEGRVVAAFRPLGTGKKH